MRAKLLTLLLIAVSGGTALLAGSQPWISFVLDGETSPHSATGHVINPALSPIAIAIVAAALALTIAGKGFRVVLGVLVTLLGAGVVAMTLTSTSSPLGAVNGTITELTGITDGVDQVMELAMTPWPWVTLAAGVLAGLLGLFVLITGRRWAQGGRKYESGTHEPGTKPTGKPDRISDWDALSDGDDPTQNL
ncbi:Trp biosynthesis-associated membrane protein [Leucobacter sp. CSA2]|uniref:Trp biosynthesis-associated membrane protein n=1 Tax=Leucobacter edaphi TaxID=2796472 RepID=A0A934UXD1_9MICO|nr:Trp biosynthesis-associated membrane protein [Leucobacter edaphi]MBK0421476.1 Trp biosynthesis-associated membrane protein [Leucobacter edaphi]